MNNIHKIIFVVPARLNSSRLPKKVLAEICGVPMLKRVLETCDNFNYEVLACVDSEELENIVKSWGFKVLRTSKYCQSGSERIASVIDSILSIVWDSNSLVWDKSLRKDRLTQTVIINVQADQPFLDKNILKEMIIRFINKSNSLEVLTPIYPLEPVEIHNENIVKALINLNSEAIYFSRHALPFIRDVKTSEWHLYATFWGHIGIYGFRGDIIDSWTRLTESSLEKLEKLEQLRLIDSGYKISTYKVKKGILSVDTLNQLKEANKLCRRN
tara:strand:+ start:747 stop:1559 length:813 start_codon:yes stop_codon:yes gene_type:complete